MAVPAIACWQVPYTAALLNTLIAQAVGQVVNIGSDQPVSILGLAELVVQLAGSESEITFQSYTDAYDADFEDIRRRVPDLARLRSLIDDPIEHDLESIVRNVIAAYRQGS